jgi:hypothetical protein
MALEPLKIVKRWFTNSPNVQECWDEIADKVSAFASRSNNNLKQLGVDLGGETYDFNNQGKGNQSVPLVTRMAALETPNTAIGTQNLALDLSTPSIVKLVQANGTALSSTLPGKATFNSTSDIGGLVTRNITAELTLTLTGCHWGLDTLGDLTDRKLWILLIDTGSTVILGVDATGGRKTVTAADAETVSTSVNSIEKVFVTSEPGGEYNCIYLGWVNANFDDTGNAGGENFWTIQTGVGDINLGRGENDKRTFTDQITFQDNVTFKDTVTLEKSPDIQEALPIGAKSPGFISNIGVALSSGVFSIVDSNGSVLSTTNYGWVTVPSATAGRSKTIKVTAGGSIQDNNGSSDLVNEEFGITSTADWAQDIPFFLYVANRNDSNVDGVDGSSVFFISRLPNLTTTPASANDIGDTGAIPSNDSQNVIVVLQDVTIANYTSLPCQLVGAIRMRYATSTHDWTIQTLGQTDGIGKEQLDKTFATLWTFPTGQMGASSGGYVLANGGTPPVFSNNSYLYKIRRDGLVRIFLNSNGDGGTDGSGAVVVQVALPLSNCSSAMVLSGCYVTLTYSGVRYYACYVSLSGSASYFTYTYCSADGVMTNPPTLADFANGSRSIVANLGFQV